MDHESFDRLARLLGSTGSRRRTLAALAGAGFVGSQAIADAKNKRNNRKAKKRKGKSVAIQAADCLSPGPSSNMNGCNYNNANFVNTDLSSSSMIGTKFRGANLCRADLSSSQLRDTDFRGFPATGPGAGNPTNLTFADLSSSGCRGTQFNSRTIFCQTKTCNGAIRNDGCPTAPGSVCCLSSECNDIPLLPEICQGNRCCIPNGTPILVNSLTPRCCSQNSAIVSGIRTCVP